MTDTVFTMGYAGRSAVGVWEFTRRIRATLVDIRYYPQSRTEEWQYDNLRRMFGVRYIHLQSLGNINYRTAGAIRIVDIDAGITSLRKITGTAILLCGCKDWKTCHRTVVAASLREAGFAVKEITLDGEIIDTTHPTTSEVVAQKKETPQQGSLF